MIMARLTPSTAIHRGQTALTAGTLTDIDFLAWIATAESGASLEYHRGFWTCRVFVPPQVLV